MAEQYKVDIGTKQSQVPTNSMLGKMAFMDQDPSLQHYYIKAEINSLPFLGTKNLLINGGFDIWQRGENISAADLTYTADRWIVYAEGAALAVAKSSGTGEHPNAMQITGASGNTTCNIVQRVEAANIGHLTDGSITFTAKIYTDTPITVSYSLDAALTKDGHSSGFNYGVHTGSFPQCSVGWNELSVTIPSLNSAAAANGFQFQIILGAVASGSTRKIAGAQIEKGSIATPFEHRPIGLELLLCKRYYEQGVSKLLAHGGIAFGGGMMRIGLIEKRSTPALSTTITDTQSYAYGLNTEYEGNGFRVWFDTDTVVDQFAPFTWTADAEL